MTTEQPSVDASEVLCCIAQHATFVDALRDGPKYKSELADELDVTKVTIYNWYTNLEAFGLVHRTSRGYGLSSIGHLHAALYADAVSESEAICTAAPILQELPPDDLPPRHILSDAEVTTVHPDPGLPRDVLIERRRSAETLQCLSPVLSARSFKTVVQAVRAEKLTAEFVTGADALDRFTQAHESRFERFVQSDGLSVLETTQSIPFGLSIVGGPVADVALIAYSEQGHVTGVVRTDAPEAIEWAHQTYQTYREGALEPEPSSSARQ